MLAFLFLVVQHRVTMGKGPPANILPRHSYRVAINQQGGVGHNLGKPPIDLLGTGTHLAPVLQQLADLALNRETRRRRCDGLRQRLDLTRRHPGV